MKTKTKTQASDATVLYPTDLSDPVVALIDRLEYVEMTGTFMLTAEINPRVGKRWKAPTCTALVVVESTIRNALLKKGFRNVFVYLEDDSDEDSLFMYYVIGTNDLRLFVDFVTPFVK